MICIIADFSQIKISRFYNFFPTNFVTLCALCVQIINKKFYFWIFIEIKVHNPICQPFQISCCWVSFWRFWWIFCLILVQITVNMCLMSVIQPKNFFYCIFLSNWNKKFIATITNWDVHQTQTKRLCNPKSGLFDLFDALLATSYGEW